VFFALGCIVVGKLAWFREFLELTKRNMAAIAPSTTNSIPKGNCYRLQVGAVYYWLANMMRIGNNVFQLLSNLRFSKGQPWLKAFSVTQFGLGLTQLSLLCQYLRFHIMCFAAIRMLF
jgi:hypothetical protein